MSIQHKDIPESNLHEPKGVSSATANKVYLSDGLGSGAWNKVSSAALQGLSGDAGVSGKAVHTDGANGFVLKTVNAYGSMVITGNTNAFAITAAADSTLNTTTDYVLFTGTGAPWASETLYGITFNTNRLIVPVAGVYEIHTWASVTGFPSNVAKIAAKYRVNGTTFSTRHPMEKSNSSGDSGNLNAAGMITLSANDYIQLYLASSVTGNLTIANANVMLKLVRAT